MKIGLDGFALPGPRRTVLQTLDFVHDYGLDGAFFASPLVLSPTLDLGELRDVRSRADELGLYLELGVGLVNPKHFATSTAIVQLGDGDYRRGLERQIRASQAIGCTELRSALGSEADRFDGSLAWTEQLQATRAFLASLAPLLRDLGCRLNLETHGDTTTFELVRLAEAVGPDVVGICLDTANVLCRGEEPVAAARRAAPYVHQTHTKDAIVYFVDDGLLRQTRPCGEGVIPWDVLLPILGQHAPDLHLSIEDHKGLFGMRIYDPAWLALHPDLTASDLAAVVRLARVCEARVGRGELVGPTEYEAIPWEQQATARLRATVQHLRDVLQTHGLAGASQASASHVQAAADTPQ